MNAENDNHLDCLMMITIIMVVDNDNHDDWLMATRIHQDVMMS